MCPGDKWSQVKKKKLNLIVILKMSLHMMQTFMYEQTFLQMSRFPLYYILSSLWLDKGDDSFLSKLHIAETYLYLCICFAILNFANMKSITL